MSTLSDAASVGGPSARDLLYTKCEKKKNRGANVQNLDTNTVHVFRWPGDDICPQARVRIWKRVRQIYLPLVLQNH